MNSGARVGLEEPEDTVRLRGSQKSTSCSDAIDRAYGVGDGDSDGQDAVDRSLAVPLSEGTLTG